MKTKKKIGIAVVIIALICTFIAVFMSVKTTQDELNKEWNVLSTEQTEAGLKVRIVGENLMRKEGIMVEADSEESETTLANLIYDGITDDINLRWSSDNDWEDAEHWVLVSFPEQVSVGCVRLYWERLNVSRYALEISNNGKEWKTVAEFEESPSNHCQDIILNKTVSARYLRLHAYDVNKFEEDGSLYYQNISLLEMEVYAGLDDEFVINVPEVSDGENRKLKMPHVSRKYTLEFVGADYENLIDENMQVADTLSNTQVDVGYKLSRGGKTVELPAISVNIPGNVSLEIEKPLPDGYHPMEWHPVEGNYSIKDSCTIYIADDALRNTAKVFADDLYEQCKVASEIIVSTESELETGIKEGDFYLKYTDDILPEEGYRLSLGTFVDNVTVIEGKTLSGIRWGCVSFLELLALNADIQKGTVFDYPRYEVRGFGIDVGRRPIPMDLLYSIMEAMSKQKMNTLLLHLNDNEIISQSNHDGTVESIRNLYSGFRLESDIKNSDGVGLTSTDFFYTKEELHEFIETAYCYGVRVVPEIDTPAHSLALIKVYPQIGKTDDVHTADQLDVSKEETLTFVKAIWDEYLLGKSDRGSVFESCDVVHIGMDEYYGDRSAFATYLTGLTEHINKIAPDKTIRMWGSLSGMGVDYSELSRDIQVQIWNTEWADPIEMYQAGFDIINSHNKCLYIIPGGGYDRLDVEYLDKEWEPNVFVGEQKTWEIPTYSSQMLGACYMLWNDMILLEDVNISNEDIFERFYQPLPIIGQKLWD